MVKELTIYCRGIDSLSMAATLSTHRAGYDHQFINIPLDMLLHKICHLPNKQPHLSICCDHTFCKSCKTHCVVS